MTAKNTVELGNAHLDALMSYTREMVAANRVPAERAPEFMCDLSESIMAAVNRHEVKTVALPENTVAPKNKKDRNTMTTETPVNNGKVRKFAKTAKMREKLLADAVAAADDSPLPAFAQAQRYIAPKRGVGRPRKDAAPVVLTPEQQAFDRAFLEAYPVREGMTAENSVGYDKITVIFDGKRLKMIKRHLETKYGITFEDYLRIYSLPADYPSVAPGYADERRKHAKRQGLGTEKVPKIKSKEDTVKPMRVVSKASDGGAKRGRLASTKATVAA